MKNTILKSAMAAAATVIMTSAAFASCPPGYKSVKIQGNWVCMLDAAASTNLQANPKPTLPQGQVQVLQPKKLSVKKR